ncbi:MAG TPA: hypothetical protein VGM39_02600 [Kofleriaceae bacterium]
MIALAGCDIVGNDPGNQTAHIDVIQAGCAGANRTYDVYFRVDATLSTGDGITLDWFIQSSFSDATFAPTIDCGWWSGGLTYNDATGAPDTAFCVRGSGPPRQIVTLTGVATLDTSNHNNQLFPEVTVTPDLAGTSQTQQATCAN